MSHGYRQILHVNKGRKIRDYRDHLHYFRWHLDVIGFSWFLGPFYDLKKCSRYSSSIYLLACISIKLAKSEVLSHLCLLTCLRIWMIPGIWKRSCSSREGFSGCFCFCLCMCCFVCFLFIFSLPRLDIGPLCQGRGKNLSLLYLQPSFSISFWEKLSLNCPHWPELAFLSPYTPL